MSDRKKTNKKDTTLVAVWLPKDLAERLKSEATRQDLTKSQLMRKAIKNQILPA